MTQDKVQKVFQYLNENLNFVVSDYISDEDMQSLNNADDIYDYLLNDGVFEQVSEVIYYSNAIEYLTENDPSLMNSLGLAEDFGYSMDKVNSELLATLHKTQKIKEEFESLKNDIDAIINA